MIGSYIKYGAICSKVRVMYGRLLSVGDYNTLLSKPDIQEIVLFLKKHPSYAEMLEHVNEKLIHRSQLESILYGSLMNDYKKLINFTATDDKQLFKMLASRTEIQYILDVLRNIKIKTSVNQINYGSYGFTEIADSVRALSRANTLEEFINLLEKTGYAGLLSNFNLHNFNFSQIENILTIHFILCFSKQFIRFMTLRMKNYSIHRSVS